MDRLDIIGWSTDEITYVQGFISSIGELLDYEFTVESDGLTVGYFEFDGVTMEDIIFFKDNLPL